MDLNRLSMFVRVVDDGSFTAAAAALGLRKSSVSRGLARLEEDLGVKLLYRTTRSLTLTDAGRAYYERVREAMAGVDDATAHVRELGSEPQGTVRLTAVPDLASAALPVLLARFVRRYPKIRVELVLTSRTVDLSEEGIDLALRGGKLPDSTLLARKLFASDLELFASPSYLKRRGKPKTLRDLATHDCVLYKPQAGKNVWRLTGPSGDESVEVRGPLAADDMQFVRRAVAAGAGIGLIPLPVSFSAAHAAPGEFVRVLPEYGFRGGALYLVSAADRQKLARVKLLHDFLVKSLTGWVP